MDFYFEMMFPLTDVYGSNSTKNITQDTSQITSSNNGKGELIVGIIASVCGILSLALAFYWFWRMKEREIRSHQDISLFDRSSGEEDEDDDNSETYAIQQMPTVPYLYELETR
jgi:flagellar basal body-associated protein FliL